MQGGGCGNAEQHLAVARLIDAQHWLLKGHVGRMLCSKLWEIGYRHMNWGLEAEASEASESSRLSTFPVAK
jgi:hypothetical protein